MNQILAYWDFGVIIATFLISSFLVNSSYRRMGLAKITLDERIGKPQWNFSTSWATTLTTVGALLGTVISTLALMDIKMQSGLSLFFGLVVVIAPLIYSASVKRLPLIPPTKDAAYQYQGTVRLFLISSMLTVWAVSGELVTISTSFYALLQGNFISVLTLIVFCIVLLLALIYTYSYAYKSIPWTIEDQLTDKISQQLTMHARKKPSFSYESARPLEAFENLSPEEKTEVKSYNPPSKNWSLL